VGLRMRRRVDKGSATRRCKGVRNKQWELGGLGVARGVQGAGTARGWRLCAAAVCNLSSAGQVLTGQASSSGVQHMAPCGTKLVFCPMLTCTAMHCYVTHVLPCTAHVPAVPLL
jgi:hypothetical protein